MMTNAQRFDWAVLVAESELIAEAARPYLESDGQAQMVEQNVLLFPGLLATLRRFDLDDAGIGLAMLDPHKFADEFAAGLEDPDDDRPQD